MAVPTAEDIRRAAHLLHGRIIRTPLIYSPTFSKMTGAEVYLKLENLQETGSFKIRGATVKIESCIACIGPKGVVAASAGNHAQGVSLAARRAGLPATIVMPVWASISKQEATRNYGGTVILEGQNISESIRKAGELAETGMSFIHPFDDRDIVAGQGTVGLEIMEDLPDAHVIVVPVGGGGLIGGVAAGAHALSPSVRIVGVQAMACPSAEVALRAGHVVRVEAEHSIADGIAVKQVGEIPFSLIREHVERIALVDEDQIAAAILLLLERKKVLAEGAGAVALAALVNGLIPMPSGAKVVLVISGGNVDSPLLGRVIHKGLARKGRLMRFSVTLEDVPGALAQLLTRVAALGANVLHITHDRTARDLPISLSRVVLELETRGPDHIEEVYEALRVFRLNVIPV